MLKRCSSIPAVSISSIAWPAFSCAPGQSSRSAASSDISPRAATAAAGRCASAAEPGRQVELLGGHVGSAGERVGDAERRQCRREPRAAGWLDVGGRPGVQQHPLDSQRSHGRAQDRDGGGERGAAVREWAVEGSAFGGEQAPLRALGVAVERQHPGRGDRQRRVADQAVLVQGVQPAADGPQPAGGDEVLRVPVHQHGRGDGVSTGDQRARSPSRAGSAARTSRRRAGAPVVPRRARVCGARTAASRRPGGDSGTTRRGGPAGRRRGSAGRPRPAGWPSRCGPARGRTARRTSDRGRPCASGTAPSPETPGPATRPGSSPPDTGRRRSARSPRRAASGAVRMASAARYTPAGQPSVRRRSAPAVSSEPSTPAWARTARASSSLNARSSGPSSTERSSLRSRPKPSINLDPTARWKPAGRPAANARMKFVASTFRNSCTSSSTSTPGRSQLRSDANRCGNATRCRDPSPTASARNTAGSNGSIRSNATATCPAKRTGSPSAASTVTHANGRESSAAH